jgi:hypothetical protein
MRGSQETPATTAGNPRVSDQKLPTIDLLPVRTTHPDRSPHPAAKPLRPMKRNQFDQRIRALKRAVDDWAASPNHAPLLVHLEKDNNLGLAPLDPELLPFPLAADANRLHNGPHSDPSADDPDRDTLCPQGVLQDGTASGRGCGWSASEPPVHQRFAAPLSRPVPGPAEPAPRVPVRLATDRPDDPPRIGRWGCFLH